MESEFLGKARSIHVVKRRIIKPSGGAIRGSVSDIKIFDSFDPLTGSGKMVDYHKGGNNTISSGASFELLKWAFLSKTDPAPSTWSRYVDAQGYAFPSSRDLRGWGGITDTNGTSYIAPSTLLFGQVVGLKGGASGLSSHQTVLSNLQAGWWLGSAVGSASDWGTASSPPVFKSTNASTNASSTTNSYASPTIATSIAKDQSSNGGVPFISLNVTVTSSSTAQPYTIDSIGWVPRVAGRTASVSTTNVTTVYNGYWTPNTDSVNDTALTFNTAPTVASASATPSTFSTYLSALFVLPYLVTVNPSGAIQFTYTFQGS